MTLGPVNCPNGCCVNLTLHTSARFEDTNLPPAVFCPYCHEPIPCTPKDDPHPMTTPFPLAPSSRL